MMGNESGFGRPVVGVLASVLLLGGLRAAEAQSDAPKFELFGGYAFLRDLGEGGTNLPLGWDASIARNFTDSLGIAFDVGGNYKSEGGVTVNEHSFLGGARYSFRRERLTPYLEGLGGMVRAGASSGSLSSSTWDFAVQAGGGLGFKVKDNLSIRTGVDFRNIFTEGDSSQQFRILVGVTFGLGGSREAAASPAPRRPAPSSVPLPGPEREEPGAPKFELFGGYAFLRDLGEGGTNLPLGWDASIARNFTDSLGVAFDVGGSYRSEGGASVNEHSFLGGARYSFRRERLTPYLEGLGGMVRTGASSGSLSASTWDFAVQAGGGLGFKVKDNLSIRTGVDFRNIFTEGDSSQQFRILVGVTFGLGGSRETAVSPAPRRPAPLAVPESERTLPPVSPPPAVRTATPPPPPRVEEPARPPAPVRPQAAQPRAPQSLDQGRDFLRGGSHAQAADAFREHLRLHAADKFTIAVGLFCEASNIAQLVQSSGNADQLLLLSAPRGGRGCYGLYWGLFDSRPEARRALNSLPATLRTGGQTPVSVSRLLQ